MRRKRNWFFKRMILGFAVMALAVPAVANAKVDESGAGQGQSNGYVAGVTDFPSKSQAKAGDFGMPRAMPSDYALQRGDSIEIARLHERNTVRPGDMIENVRLQPRTVSTPQAVSAGFDWGDAGIGAGVLLGLVLVGGAAVYATRQVGRPQTA